MEKEKIAIYLNEDEAVSFKLFRQHQGLFALLLDSGVFNVKSGEVTIRFDHEGHVMQVLTNQLLFKR